MSNKKDVSLNKALVKESYVPDDLITKERELYIDRIESNYELLKKKKQESANLENLNIVNTPDEVKHIINESKSYLKSAVHSMPFILEDFQGYVPFFARNLILVLARTGTGKSTATANIAYNTIQYKKDKEQKSPTKVLIITNEENPSDVYNRITALAANKSYSNHAALSDKDIELFSKGIEVLSKYVSVIYEGKDGISGLTTTVEGIESIFEKLLRKDTPKYDAIIIDYYQNIYRSIHNPGLADWQVQGLVANLIDNFKNRYPAPIVVMAQKSDKAEDGSSYKHLIEGRKSIANKATCIIEMIPDFENMTTEWVIKKSRFNGSVGHKIITGFKNGKYVKYTTDFQYEVEKLKEKRAQEELNKALGMSIKEKIEEVKKQNNGESNEKKDNTSDS